MLSRHLLSDQGKDSVVLSALRLQRDWSQEAGVWAPPVIHCDPLSAPSSPLASISASV